MTINLTIDINASELNDESMKIINALNAFKDAVSGEAEQKELAKKAKKAVPEKSEAEQVLPRPLPVPAYPQPAPIPAIPTAAAQYPQPAPIPAIPTAAAQPAPAIPVAPPVYTLEQLSAAAAPLMDAGLQAQLIGLLTKYGVQALTMLPKEAYPAFAADLRALGAKI